MILQIFLLYSILNFGLCQHCESKGNEDVAMCSGNTDDHKISSIGKSDMATTYKLSYFPAKARGEAIRYLLSYGEVEFEDNRIPKQDWPKYKGDMPFGQLPVLEVNGKMTHQSIAIARYLAKQFKLTGKNDWEDLEIDTIVATVVDLGSKIGAYWFEADEAVKAKLKETLDTVTIPFYLERLEAIAKANKGHLALGKLTWADLHFASMADMFSYCSGSDLFSDRENLRAVIKNVENLPAIKAWIEKRPKSDF